MVDCWFSYGCFGFDLRLTLVGVFDLSVWNFFGLCFGWVVGLMLVTIWLCGLFGVVLIWI